jgi:hypothetical protein
METITIDKNAVKVVFELLGIKNPHCHSCHKKINKNNFGYISYNVLSCNNFCCLAEGMVKEDRIKEKEVEKNGV